MQRANFLSKKINPNFRYLIYLILFVLISYTAYSFRNFDYKKEIEGFSNFYPYTYDSAIKYNNIKNIIDNKVSDSDPLEYAIAYSYKFYSFIKNYEKIECLPVDQYGNNKDLSNFISIAIRILGSLIAGLIFLILLINNCSKFLSIIGGLLYAVLPAAIGKFTGLNILDLNLGLPILTLFYLNYFICIKKKSIIYSFTLGFLLFLSLLVWDLSQINLILLSIYLLFISLLPKKTESERKILITIFTSSIFSALAVGFIKCNFIILFSPAIIILLPTALFVTYFKGNYLKSNVLLKLLIFLILLLGWFFLFSHLGYVKKIHPFIELVKAKIHFNNIKPIDPEKLSFNLRLIWDVPYNSASYYDFWILFHFTFIFFAMLLFITFLYPNYRANSVKNFKLIILPIFLTLVYFTFYVYLNNFYSLTAIFCCISIPLLCENIRNNIPSKKKILFNITLFILLLIEFEWFLQLGKADTEQYRVKAELIKWLNTGDLKNKTILTTNKYSSEINTYTKAHAIPVYNQIDNTGLMDLKTFFNILYNKNETNLVNYCEKNNINYLLLTKDITLGDEKQKYFYPWMPRYLASNTYLKKTSPAFILIKNSDSSRHFYKIDQILPDSINPYFVFFKVISEKDMKRTQKLIKKTKIELNNGNLTAAKQLIDEAVYLVPNSIKARFLYYQIYKKWPYITIKGLESKNLSN